MDVDDVLQMMQAVPDYQAFLTVDELDASARALAARFPEAVTLLPLGRSRQGSPITALRIGNGSRKGLLFAMPHPNEPIGSMMLEFFTTRLAEDADLRDRLDYTWYVIKCIDVDGTRLNEGWFKGPFSITNYARHFYRPPGHLQVEWTFPIDYKELHFCDPLPETQALMRLIEEQRPDFIYSLHNSGFGGVYAYLSHEISAYYPDFYRVVDSQQLPLHLGEAEVPYARTFSKAVFGMIEIETAYDFLEQNGVENPAAVIRSGASSMAYARRFGDPLGIVVEMPYFYHPAIHDTSPSDMVRRDAILAGLKQSRAHADLLRRQYDAVKDSLTVQSAFRDTLEATLAQQEGHLAAQENWAKNDPALDAQATVAEKFDNLYVRRFYELLSTGMFVRMIEEEMRASGETPVLSQALEAMQAEFEREAAALENEIDYDVVPIQKLVRVQLGAGLLFADYVGKRSG